MEYHAPGSYSYRKETALMLTVRNLHKYMENTMP